MRNTGIVAAVAAAVGLSVGACGGGERAPEGGEQAATTTQATGPMGDAVVMGTVKLTGTPPRNPRIDMAEEPKCRAKYPSAPANPVVVTGSGGGLANVFVYVKAGLPAGAQYTAPTAPVAIDQDGCLYHPRVLGLMVGQPLEIRNSDSLLHNIKAVPASNRPFNISQPAAGMRTTRTFNTPEVMVPLECNVHGWMNAYVGVVTHPFHAVSGENGSFTISGLPAGTYTIEAWHERFGTRTATVTVAAGGSATADFTFAAQ
ncbi:MAG: carboxypeptidase regulatory-like domain-containing protein [Gemmatimonadales bacterium]